jgi:hypothetical protein
MAKRSTPPLAYSEYVSADSDNSIQVWRARLLVIDLVKRLYPIFLKKLSSDVFPLYQRAKRRERKRKENNLDKALWGKSPYDALRENGGLKSAPSKWAAHFNAEDGWVMVGALRSLRDWYVAPELRESLEWHTQHGRKEGSVIANAFEFRHQRWEVQVRTWSAYVQSLRQSFETKLLEYERQTRELAESRAWSAYGESIAKPISNGSYSTSSLV